MQIRNHEAVVRFALRGPGQPGPRPVSAPLSDPTAVPATQHTAEADAALRHVVHALLVGVEAKQVSQQALQVGGLRIPDCKLQQRASTCPALLPLSKIGSA